MLVVSVPLTAATGYYLHAAIWGTEGYFVLEQRRAEIEAREEQLRQVRDERIRREDRAGRLRTGSIDLDLLNERAREVLGYARPDELILLIPETR